MPSTPHSTVQAARAISRRDLDGEIASLTSNEAKLNAIVGAVDYGTEDDAAAESLMLAIAANRRRVERLERRLAHLGSYETASQDGQCPTP